MEHLSRKDLRDYIHNYLGISKSAIRDAIIEEIQLLVKEEVSRCIKDEQWLENIIKQEVIRTIKSQDDIEGKQYLITSMNSIYNTITKEIHNLVCEKVIIALKGDDASEFR